MGVKINKAVSWAVGIAKDNTHGYDQINRWGKNYDCSSLVISAYERAGVKVKTAGATYTGNMYNAFIKCGFKDVTSKVNKATGARLVKGDVLLNHQNHTAMMIDAKNLVQASINEKGGIYGGKSGDQTGKEIHTRRYYNYPWNCVLRYPEKASKPAPVKKKYTKGTKLTLKNNNLYVSATSLQATSKATGTFYLYDGAVVNGRMRITNKKSNCGKNPVANYVTGWINKSDI